jgi:hypothetical protein
MNLINASITKLEQNISSLIANTSAEYATQRNDIERTQADLAKQGLNLNT